MVRSHLSSYAVLLAICTVNVLLRFPRGEHEMGIDSFVFHNLINSLVGNQTARWVLTPLSYFGLYPLSEPGGSIFLIATNRLIAGLTVEWSILEVDLVVAIFGTLGAFLLGREFFRNDRDSLVLSLFMSTTPEFVTFLNWQVPTRIVFTALLPFLLFFVVRFSRNVSMRSGLMMCSTLVLMMSFHRLAILTALVLLASLGTAILLVLLRTLRTKFPDLFLSPIVRRNASWVAAGGIIASAGFMFVSTGVLGSYSEGEVARGNTLGVQLLNLTISLSRSGGLLLPLTAVGVVAITRRRAKSFSEPFMVLALLSFIPTLFLRQYTGFYTIPLTSLFAVVGLAAVLGRARSHRGKSAVLAAALAVALTSSYGIISYDLALEGQLSTSVHDLGIYSQTLPPGTWVFNDGLTGARFGAVSGEAYLPIGGATTPFQGPELLAFGFLRAGSLDIRLAPPSQLTFESDSPFVLSGVQAEADWGTILSSMAGSIPAALINQYSPKYVVADATFPTQFYAYAHYYDSALLVSVQSSRYQIYSDAWVVVWQL